LPHGTPAYVPLSLPLTMALLAVTWPLSLYVMLPVLLLLPLAAVTS
jgi:hypothetical protein